jgi:hypothetical protein
VEDTINKIGLVPEPGGRRRRRRGVMSWQVGDPTSKIDVVPEPGRGRRRGAIDWSQMLCCATSRLILLSASCLAAVTDIHDKV